MESNGFVKIYRKMFNDPLWLNGTPTQKILMVYLIGMANHSPQEWDWQGEKIKLQRGQYITSIEKLQKGLGLGVTKQNIRTALKNLEKYKFLTNQSTKTGRLITILNYDKYQDSLTKKLTKTQQRPNKDLTMLLTPNKNIYKNDKNDNKDTKYIYSRVKEIKEIISYLNEKAETNYKSTTKKTQELIKARFNEGFSVDDFKTVIDKKIKSWAGTEWEKFIRPETLFGTKFESYLNEKISKGGASANNRGSPKRFENEREYTDEEQKRIEEKFYA